MGLLELLYRLKPSSHILGRVLILGVDNAGKTCILKKLSNDDTNTTPTHGFNIKTLTAGRLKFCVWDIGGQKSVRHYWRHYFGEANVLVFVVDSADMQRMEEASVELRRILVEEKLAGLPLLVFANKEDLPGSISAEELRTFLHLENVCDRSWHVQSCSAKTGEGLDAGLSWVMNELKRKLSNRRRQSASRKQTLREASSEGEVQR